MFAEVQRHSLLLLLLLLLLLQLQLQLQLQLPRTHTHTHTFHESLRRTHHYGCVSKKMMRWGFCPKELRYLSKQIGRCNEMKPQASNKQKEAGKIRLQCFENPCRRCSMMCRFSMLKLTRIYPENRSTSTSPWSKSISELERSPFATGHKTLIDHA